MSRYRKNTIDSRIKFYYFACILLFSGLLTRLYYLQVYDKRNLKLQCLKQRSTEISLKSKRGTIFDRNLIPLTNKENTKTLIAPRETIVKDEEILRRITQNTDLSPMEINQILNTKSKLIQIPLREEISLEKTNNAFLVDITNRYSKANLLSHVIGYINKAENRGESGIEKVYDEFLNKSDKSSIFIEYDKNRSLVLGGSYYVDNSITPDEPAGVKLTTDYNIQRTVEEILDEDKTKGAVIVSDIDTAEILALASRPNFNQEHMEEYFNREDMALYNKAIQVSYPPGSIFKIVVLLTALEEDPSIIDRKFYCKGYERINNVNINCNSTHGNISLKNGFAKSCNSVFIQIGKEMGAKKVIEMAKRLGFGQKINIGLIEEVEGNLPEGEELLGPAIGNISIGQGKIEATPLQISNMLLIIANDGIQKDMTIVQGITTKDGKIIKPYNKLEDRRVISERSSSIAKELLEEVVRSGTARKLRLDDIGSAAGKTGSAEGLLKSRPTIYGWFSGYYPRDNPRYVITVLAEEANSGSASAAPIFERICRKLQ
ncbi:penicillin-binding transpeptidase domain-containing protein [Tissierella praeacuta]|uniref:peptidoglycan D,D-transpeptidase FtsI family protein n=1 Tax=Tissierella praeacuta TaxID=43131 RepID=UPI00333F84AE